MVAVTTEVEAPRAPCSHCSVVLQDSIIDDPFHRRHYSANIIKAFLSDSKRTNQVFLIDIYRLVVHAQMPRTRDLAKVPSCACARVMIMVGGWSHSGSTEDAETK